MTYIKAFNAEKAYTLTKKPFLFKNAMVEECELGSFTEVRDFASLSQSRLGDYSYVSEYTQIANTTIGKFVNIASHVRINPGFHPFEMPAQHHFLYRRELYGFGKNDASFFHYRSLQRVEIGHDVWIGHGAVIMPGVCIGNGAIIGANAVVTKDVPAFAVVTGVAAKVLKYRFPKKVQEALEGIAWWDWSHELLEKRMGDFYNIREFIYKYGN